MTDAYVRKLETLVRSRDEMLDRTDVALRHSLDRIRGLEASVRTLTAERDSARAEVEKYRGVLKSGISVAEYVAATLSPGNIKGVNDHWVSVVKGRVHSSQHQLDEFLKCAHAALTDAGEQT